MKKVLILLAVAGASYLAWKRYADETDSRDLWAEVTDTFE